MSPFFPVRDEPAHEQRLSQSQEQGGCNVIRETMLEERSTPTGNASQLQEAIDILVQMFDHPSTLSIEYHFDTGTKQTVFEVQTAEDVLTYELRYEGQHDEMEPEIIRRE
jgi:hypothetical protein